MSRFIRLMVAGILFAALVTSLTAESSGLMASEAADPGTPSEFFHQRVEPVLKRHCYECHSHNSGVMESGLALDWKNGWVTGGKRGPAIVPGRPEESLLIRAISHLDEHLKMPEEKLAEDQIATLTEWVRSGAWDDRVAEPKPQDPLDWWSLKPLLAPALPEKNDQTETSFHPIDLFVSARLKDSGLSLSERATPRDLVRRLFMDLHGLPPSPQEVASFESDPSPEAYAKMVDRLLDSPRYGERWARHWFDTIHFADSHGYEHDVGRDNAWPYRDYVIRSLNSDLPWGEFIRQQMAVDHFHPEAVELLPALGFLGAGTFDYSTYATGPVTFDYMDRDDMLTQTMSAFVSTTANCARCHSHKFDPISQEDYYALQAVFSGILKGDIRYDADSRIAAERKRLEALKVSASQRDANVMLAESSQTLVKAWIEERPSRASWTPLQLHSFISAEGSTLTKSEDGMILAGGTLPEVDTYVLTGSSELKQITAIRLDLFPHESLPMNGPGRCQNGNLHLSEFIVNVFASGASTGQPIRITRATADFNQDGWSIERSIDGDPKTAWGIHPAIGQAHHAVFELEQPLELSEKSQLSVKLRQLHGTSHLIGAFRISVSDAAGNQTEALPKDVEDALRIADAERTDPQKVAIAAYVVAQSVDAQLKALPDQTSVYAVGASVAIPMGSGKSQAASLPKPKAVHVLHRGDISQPRDVVLPGALSALQHRPGRFEGLSEVPESSRRAALAEWIAHRDNVLTWRSIVNRAWHYHFGRGLCDTPSDFGRMGGTPSHPELIDWLAVWFRDEAGGSLKQLHRLIVTSQTWQQSSTFRENASAVDSENRLLWRQNSVRMDADAARDAVLSVSGVLDLTMGGPAIQHFHQSPGAQLTPKLEYSTYDWSSPGANRRSIYRFVWRGIPDPLMAALDFPDLGLLSPTRGFTASPLQALALYNNHFMLHFSEKMAQDITMQDADPDAQINELIRRTYLRSPTDEERQLLRAYRDDHSLAALCRVILNSSEFLFVR